MLPVAYMRSPVLAFGAVISHINIYVLLIQSTQLYSGYLLCPDIYIYTLKQEWKRRGSFVLF